ncbi:MAG: LytTR family transcriptional regulator DNA-binding domain-containing protein [Tissierellales bacterium]|nr:LytTR family transcriptional regulator DNA-binding domain-containing protein [Tissierellales bacterium]MBN2827532.1 LytTR family transcriptional regulator DNA-binding domain-containing protein [Tissierellales bacterium]
MKYEVLIYKDHQNSRLRESVEQYFSLHSINYSIEEFEIGENIEEILKNITPDFVFLHHFPEAIEIAKKVKNVSPESIIILIGNLSTDIKKEEEDLYDTVLYRPFTQERINEILNTSFEKIKKNLKLFMFKHDEKMKIIPYRDILLFEKQFSGIKIYTKNKEYFLRENMNRLVKSLDSDYFAKCSSRHVINLTKIISLTAYKCKISDYDGEIPVRRRYLDKVYGKIK